MLSRLGRGSRWIPCSIPSILVVYLFFIAACMACPAVVGALTLSVPADHATIQSAIVAAGDQDTVLVAAGIYLERIDLLGKALLLLSSDGPDVTTIDAGGAGTVVTFQSGEGPGTVLSGFTITGGHNDAGGGGVRCVAASPTIEGNVVRDNWGAGGGGFLLQLSSSLIRDNTIRDNLSSGFLKLGGGMLIEASSSPLISGNLFESNQTSGQFSAGAGLVSRLSSPTVVDNVFSGNISGDSCGGILFDEHSTGLIEGNVLIANVGGDGAGILIIQSTVDVLANVLIRNRGRVGAGIYTIGQLAVGEVAHNTLVGTESNGWTALEAGPFSNPGFSNNTVAFSVNAEAMFCTQSSARTRCNNLFGNELGDDICGLDLGGNISADPLFCDLDADDLTLRSDSPNAPSNSPEDCGLIGALPVGCTTTAIGAGPIAPTFAGVRLGVAPNPAVHRVRFTLALDGATGVLEVFDALGRHVDDLPIRAGQRTLEWTPPRQAASGVYFARLISIHGVERARFLVLR